MKTELALRLLRDVMGWDNPTATEEISKIEYLAAVKYDGYLNFGPGRRFLESLVLWLRQFVKSTDRQVAYDFVMERLIYISEVQMDHLAGLLYPQRVLPILLKQTFEATGISPYKMKRLRTSAAFKAIERKTLYLGMSDGARMDAFRRKNALHNDQVSVSYELNPEKWTRMHEALKGRIAKTESREPCWFENIFLIDDFSGSGNSILIKSDKKFKGKFQRFVDEALGHEAKPKELGRLCNKNGPKVHIVTYIATEQALSELRKNVSLYLRSAERPCVSYCEVLPPLQLLHSDQTVPQPSNPNDELLDDMLYGYYDSRIEDANTRTGGRNVIHGYGGCALPLVLSHNCPNSSVYLLWAQTERSGDCPGLKALFPRISRHWEGR